MKNDYKCSFWIYSVVQDIWYANPGTDFDTEELPLIAVDLENCLTLNW